MLGLSRRYPLFARPTIHRTAHQPLRSLIISKRHLIIRAETLDGVVAIPEEDLYRYTRHRWVYDESRHLSERYLKFNLDQLLKAAATAVFPDGARYCTKILKCKEGLNNKTLLLTMDDGAEVLAKLPDPCAGPAFYTTASEVATRHFLRDVLNIATPRIISWSADRNNPVGAEYILEEKAPGKPLGRLWQDWDEWPIKDRFTIIEQIVEMQRKLATTKFVKSGCIYFRKDIPNSDALVTDPPLSSSILDDFTLGPLVNRGLWCDEKASLDLDRGPYKGPQELVKAMAENEKQFIQAHAHPRMNYARSSTNYETPAEMMNLLDQYLQLAPAMVPPQTSGDIHSPTLWHPDLHLDNVFVDPDSKQINCVIDWQSAAVLPFFYQYGIPTMFKHKKPVSDDMDVMPQRPDNYDTLAPDEKGMVDNLIKSEHLHKYYLGITQNRNERHWAALQLQDEIRTQPTAIISSVWKDRDVFFLRRALLKIIDNWDDLCPGSGPCPVSFNDQEMALYAHEQENRATVSEILALFRDNWGLPPGGSVEPSKFAEIQYELKQMKDAFIAAADNDEDRLLAEKLWPYQDTIDS